MCVKNITFLYNFLAYFLESIYQKNNSETQERKVNKKTEKKEREY